MYAIKALKKGDIVARDEVERCVCVCWMLGSLCTHTKSDVIPCEPAVVAVDASGNDFCHRLFGYFFGAVASFFYYKLSW